MAYKNIKEGVKNYKYTYGYHFTHYRSIRWLQKQNVVLSVQSHVMLR